MITLFNAKLGLFKNFWPPCSYFTAINFCKQRQNVSVHRVSMMYRIISIIRCIAKIGRGIMEWIISHLCKTCVHTTVTLFPHTKAL